MPDPADERREVEGASPGRSVASAIREAIEALESVTWRPDGDLRERLNHGLVEDALKALHEAEAPAPEAS